jgi:hypothetical protein
MSKYVMRLEGYQNVDSEYSCVQHGMLQCKFNKYNKMVSAEIMYDVMGFMQQLQVPMIRLTFHMHLCSFFRMHIVILMIPQFCHYLSYLYLCMDLMIIDV